MNIPWLIAQTKLRLAFWLLRRLGMEIQLVRHSSGTLLLVDVLNCRCLMADALRAVLPFSAEEEWVSWSRESLPHYWN